LCLIDDARFLDAASVDTLVFVARRLSSEPIGVLVAARNDSVRQFQAPGLPELLLGGLDAEEAGALLQARVGALAPGVRDRLIAESGGSPLALQELPGALTGEQFGWPCAAADRLDLGTRLRQVFLQRVRGLPEATQRLPLVAAAEDTGELATILAAGDLLGVAKEALARRPSRPGWCRWWTPGCSFGIRWSARPSTRTPPCSPGGPPTRPCWRCSRVDGRPTGGPGTSPLLTSARTSHRARLRDRPDNIARCDPLAAIGVGVVSPGDRVRASTIDGDEPTHGKPDRGRARAAGGGPAWRGACLP
jgi:hypothetical protein